MAVLAARGRQALDDGDLDGARAGLAAALERAPADRDVLLLQALVQVAGGDVDDAEASYDRLLRLFPDDLGLVASKAFFLLDVAGDAAAALPLLEEALAFAQEADDGGDVEREDELAALCALIGRRLVEARLDAGDTEGAIAAAREALAIAYDDDSRASLAAALFSAGELDEAALVGDGAGDSRCVPLQLMTARIAVARGDEELAALAFARAAALDDTVHPPPRLSAERFAAVFAGVCAELPEPLRTWLEDVPVDLSAVVDVARLRAAGRSPGTPLLIEGPQRLPGSGDPFEHRPLSATLFQRNIELLTERADDVAAVLTAVLIEGCGIFLGLDVDDDDPALALSDDDDDDDDRR